MTAIIFIVFFALLIMGAPIVSSIGLTVFQNSIFSNNPSLDYIGRTMVKSMDNFPILAVPMFIMAGEIMGKGGISKRLFDFSNSLVGRVTAGVPMATVLTCMLFGAISGSGPATFAAVGTLMIPLMVKQGYDIKFVTGLCAASGGLGVLIPPSLPMVMYAISSNESIGKMFLSGVLPGVLSGACLMIYAYIYCKLNPITIDDESSKPMPVLKAVKDGFWALLSPVIILGGIYGGIFTATEAAAVAALYGLLISKFIYKTVKFRDLPKMIYNAASMNTPILLIVCIATVFGRVLTFQNVPQSISATILGLSANPLVIMLVINLFLLVVGMLMETLAAIIILTPILLPIAVSIGLHPIHFGAIMVANLAIGFVTPPIGTSLYVAASLTGLSIKDISKSAIWAIVALLVALAGITLLPQISLFIPLNAK